jgi:protein-arginine deiminase
MILLCTGCGPQAGLEITADTDRDGRINFQQDGPGKNSWTLERGALFFNNNDSDMDTHMPDYADDLVNGLDDLKDLAAIRIKQMPNLNENARAAVSVDEASQSRVRLFYKNQENEYVSLLPSREALLDPADLRQSDLELRIEANSYADADWNGETTVTVSVTPPAGETQSDSVLLKAAPFMLLSNLQEGKTLYVREFPGRNDAFLDSLRRLVPQAGAKLAILPAGEPYDPYDIWFQDTMEIGYSEIPGQRMNVVLKANRNRSLDEYAKNELLGPDFGWLQVGEFRQAFAGGRGGNGWLDWYGNLEVTPPVPGYPLGRIFYGFNPEGPEEASLNPEIVAMLEAQKVQAPLIRLDTGWLLIKHVDEVVSFVPSVSSERPFKVLVVDTSSMTALLETWMDEGLGDYQILTSYTKDKVTVSSLFSNSDIIDWNKALQKDRIEPNISLLKTELGLKEEDFIRVPCLFDKDGAAIIPNMVNSAILNGHIFIVSPKGPVVEGADLLEEEMRRLLKDLPLTPHFLEAGTYHMWGGEVHCATNVRREGPADPWWEIMQKETLK